MSDDADSQPSSSANSSQLSSPTSNPPWWREDKTKEQARPWVDKPQPRYVHYLIYLLSCINPEYDVHSRKATVPPEQAEGFARARQSVARAARSVLGTSVEVVHEALILSVEPLSLVPIPGLSEAGRTLLAIWDALSLVEVCCLSSYM